MSVAEAEAVGLALEPPTGLWGDAWRRLRRNPGALVGFALVTLFLTVALLAPLVAPHGPRDQQKQNGILGVQAPSLAHPFGVDQLGRDEFSRVLYGARYSLLIGVVSVAVGLSFGLLLGALAGYLGSWVDTVIMRAMDIMLSIPGLLLAIGIVAMLGPGLVQIMVAVGVTNVPVFARLLRGSILAQRENDFVLAARSVGVPRRQILASHILPNAISPVIVQGTLALATAIIDVAGLGFLGLGPQDPSTPEWGTMLTDTVRYLQTAPYLAIFPGLAIVMLVAVGAASVAAVVSSAGAKGGQTLVFASAADPKTLDPALVSDGESLRPIRQMMEGLVTLKPGTTVVKPSLALSWSVTKNRLAWTFKLRRGVKFQDGTQFNAASVCFNFNRWFNFKGPFQSPDATYYWQTVYGGFHHPEVGSPQGGTLYKGCKALKNGDARIFLNNPSGSFIGSLAIPSFSMQSPTALQKYQSDEGTVTGGVFRATGSYGTQHPTGTGPFMFQSWTLRDKLVLVRNPTYWGPKAKLQTLIFRPISDNAARLQALQTGEVQGYDLVAPEDVPTVSSNPKLKLLNRPAFNVGYVGFNQKIAPMNNPAVRQAVAYGLDREGVVKAFYGGRGQVANEFMPPQVIGYAKDVQKYTYDPAKAKDILTKAGFKLPVELDFWYPTNVSRPYMPDPQRNFEGFAASLEKSGFKITPHSAPWRPDYLGKVQSGQAQLYLLGWTGDYGDPDNFVGTFFRTAQDQWGFTNQPLFDLLNKAREETNLAKRIAMYQDANRQIMKFLPGVPYVHSTPALAFQKPVKGYIPSPVSLEPFQLVSIEGGT